jgi:hypothetical protein
MAVQLSLTAEQASLLLPVLQQLSGVQGSGAAPSTPASQLKHGSSTEMETGLESDSSTTSLFTLEQLLTNKGKNMKSTDAQNFLHVSTPTTGCLAAW